MKMYQSWKRNEPSTVSGESITVTITYSSFDKSEVDELEKRMPVGIISADFAIDGREETHEQQ